MLTLFLGVLYIFGLIIVNIHLSFFGIFDNSFIKVQYILVGFIFSLFIAVPCLTFMLPIHLSLKGKKSLLYLTLIPLGIYAFGMLWGLVFGAEGPGVFKFLWNAWKIYVSNRVIIPTILFFIYLPGLAVLAEIRNEKPHFFWKHISLRPIYVLLFGIFLSLVLYVGFIHREVDIAFGGGKFRNIDIILTESGIDVANKFGFTITNQGIIEKAKLIHENSQDYFLVAPAWETGYIKCLRLSKSLTLGAKHLSNHLSGNSIQVYPEKAKSKEIRTAPNQ